MSVRNVILIDPGHGGPDNGRIAFDRKEKDDVLKFSYALKEAFRTLGVTAYMTRTEDAYVGNNERAKIRDTLNPDLVISIHRGSSEDPEVNGISVLTSGQYLCDEIAGDILDSFDFVFDIPFVEFDLSAQGILFDSGVPTLVINVGYITNESDNHRFDADFEDWATLIAKLCYEIMEISPELLKR